MLVRELMNEGVSDKEEPFLDEQRFYQREFANLLQHMQSPSRILERARFLMGQTIEGSGGYLTLCEVGCGTSLRYCVVDIRHGLFSVFVWMIYLSYNLIYDIIIIHISCMTKYYFSIKCNILHYSGPFVTKEN